MIAVSDVPKRRLPTWRRVFVAFLLLATFWMFAWIGARLLIVNVPLEKADVLVVLSGSETLMERADLSAQLFREGRAPKILLTNDNRRGGWMSAQQRNPFFYEGAVLELRRQGVPETAIEVLQQPVESTRDEAALVRDYSRQHQVQSVLIVTSAYHSRRASRTFRQAFAGSGIRVGLQAVEPGSQTPRPAVWWLRTRGWNMVAGEYFKLAYYALRE
ncbi:hypothetical protein BH18ACI4_BH18ACI4_17800 [soil metagenome]